MSARSIWPLILMVTVITVGCPGTSNRGTINKEGKTKLTGNPDELKLNVERFVLKDPATKTSCLNLPELLKYLEEKKTNSALLIDTGYSIYPGRGTAGRTAPMDSLIAARVINQKRTLKAEMKTIAEIISDEESVEFSAASQPSCTSLTTSTGAKFNVDPIKSSRFGLYASLDDYAFLVEWRPGKIKVTRAQFKAGFSDQCTTRDATLVRTREISYGSQASRTSEVTIQKGLADIFKKYTDADKDAQFSGPFDAAEKANKAGQGPKARLAGESIRIPVLTLNYIYELPFKGIGCNEAGKKPTEDDKVLSLSKPK